MTGMFGVILFTLLPIYLNAEIKLPSFGNRTFVQQGLDIILPWTFTFDVKSVFLRQWKFSKTGKTADFESLAVITADQDPVISTGIFSGVNVTKPATLILKGASVNHDGTYRFEIQLTAGSSPPPSDIMVIIPVRPTAKASCSGKGDNVSCLCEGIDGNPPADTTWLKGNKIIKGPEYLSTTLDKDDIISNKEGVYTCKANSANLIHEDSVTLSKPKDISFKSRIVGGKIELVCKVVGPITLAPVYLISFNGSEAKEYKNGVKYIGTLNSRNIGQYECSAKNVLGTATKRYFLNETVGTDGEGDSGGLGTGAIVGIVVGVLFFIVVVVALVYWFCIKQNECCCACCVLGGKE